MLDTRYAVRFSRRMGERVGVSEDLRGWCWDRPPVEPPVRDLGLSVSEIAARYCPTMRDVFLRRVLGVKVKPTVKMVEGRVYHRVLQGVLERVKEVVYGRGLVEGYEVLGEVVGDAEERVRRLVVGELRAAGVSVGAEEYEGVVGRGVRLWRFYALKLCASLDAERSRHRGIGLDALVSRAIPQIAEYVVDGTPLGLSANLSVDVFMPTYVVMDYKTGSRRDFHRMAVAGYALALEAEMEVAVDAGAVVYIRFEDGLPSVEPHCFFVGDELRRWFLETRDAAMEIVEHGRDPGLPPRCYRFCPYLGVCRGEGAKR